MRNIRIVCVSLVGAMWALLISCQGCNRGAAQADSGGSGVPHSVAHRPVNQPSTRVSFSEIWIDTPNGWALDVAENGDGKMTCGSTHQCGFDVHTFDFPELVRRLQLAAGRTHSGPETPVCSVNFFPAGGGPAVMRPIDDWPLVYEVFQRAHRALLAENRADIDPIWTKYPPSTQP